MKEGCVPSLALETANGYTDGHLPTLAEMGSHASPPSPVSPLTCAVRGGPGYGRGPWLSRGLGNIGRIK